MCVAGGFKSVIMERPSSYNGENYRGTNGIRGAGGKWGSCAGDFHQGEQK